MVLKDFSSPSVHLNLTSFFIKLVRGYITSLYPFRNFQQKFIKAINTLMSFRFISISHSLITLILSQYIYTSLQVIINPRNYTLYQWNLHFNTSTRSLLSYSVYSILYTYHLYSLRVFKQIRILLRYTIIKVLIYLYKIVLIIVQNIISMLVSLKGITKYLKCPLVV